MAIGDTATAHRYAGEMWERELGLSYNRVRWYVPTQGRFTQMDVFAGFATDPRSLHKYGYVHADPVNGTDPSGYMTLSERAVVSNANLSLSLSNASTVTINTGRVAANDALWSASAGAASGARTAAVGLLTALALSSDSVRRDRFVGVPMIVFGEGFDGHANHIRDAQLGNGSNFIPAPFALNRFPAWPRGWLRFTSECDEEARARAGGVKACDEYPFASTRQGGPVNYVLGTASLRLLDLDESNRTRNFIGSFYNSAIRSTDGFSKDSRFIALGIQGAKSFYTDRAGNVHYWNE
jgi:RHS repeat-associated protein